ncbi:MAG: response regulator [Pseudomonadota bacterium]
MRSSDRHTVLVVDDDPVMVELAEAHLRAAGYDVALAANGQEALKTLRDKPVSLVISDLSMPVMDGFALTQNIRADARLSDTPVIVITGSDHQDAVDQAFAAGATSFLAKPMNWTLFGHAVRFVLRASEDQQALREARDKAEAGIRFKDGLLSVMSHELRTPLNAIIGFGKLLVDRCNEHNDLVYAEYADYIVDGGARLLNSISDMLLASDVRSGPITINESDATIGEVIDAAWRFTPKVATPPEIIRKIEDPTVELRCDAELLARAIAKLIDNATKFSDAPANVIIGTAATKAGGLAILVKDSGPGMEPERVKEAAKPFVQADMSVKRSKGGLGLGLPLVQAIVQAHQGAFRLNSELGEGTRVLLVLPPERLVKNNKSAASAA